MVFTSKSFGFKILGPFYSIGRMLGLILVRETNEKVGPSKNGIGDNNNESVKFCRNFTGKGDISDVFLPDRRYLAYNMVILVTLYLALRRCVTLVGSWPCGSAECSSAIEWIVTAIGAVQAMASVVVATVHRQARTIGLLNRVYHVMLIRRRGVRERRSNLYVGGAYAIIVAVIVLTRSVAVIASRSDRFSVTDVLLVCLPTAVLPIVVECTIVCMCSAAENVFRDVVDQLNKLAAANAAGFGTSRSHRLRPMHWRLELVWRDYWYGCRLVDDLSHCYGLDLAINLTVNMMLFISYAYITLMSVSSFIIAADGQRTVATVYWNVALVCQLVCVSFRIVFISYRAEKIKQVAINSVLVSLRNLLKNDNLDITSVITLLRLATTYLIVIIQYNSKS